MSDEARGAVRTRLAYDLLEALRRPGCALCQLAARAAARYLDTLSYEGVNDPAIRARLRAARGLCRAHAWHLLEDLHDALGTAIICRDVLNTLAAGLRRSAQPSSIAPTRPCPACRERDEVAGRFADALAAECDDPAIQQALRAQGGLCRAHLALALARCAAEDEWDDLLAALCERLERAREHDEPESLASLLAGLPEASARRLAAARPGRRLAPPRAPSTTTPPPACAFCQAAQAAGAAYVEHLAQAPADASAAAALLTLCGPHTWHLLAPTTDEPRRALLAAGAAALTERLARAAFPRAAFYASRAAREADRARALAQAGLATGPCPACTAARCAADGATPTGPLCLRHVVAALAQPDAAPAVAEFHRRLWEGLAQELAEFIRKTDYRFRDEPWGAEATAPRRAVSALVG